MKKLIITIILALFTGLVSLKAQIYTPIATHSFGIDSLTQLDKQLQVYWVSIDAKMNQIRVYYDVVLLSNNVVVTVVSSGSYIRDNNTPFLNFNALRISTIGQQIAYMIAQDVGKIQSIKTLETDLQQK